MKDIEDNEVVPGKVNLVTLKSLRASIKGSELVLPEFQRPEVWGDSEKKELIVSLCMGMPIGSFLIWEYSDNFTDFPHHKKTEFRAFSQKTVDSKKVKFLLLDGQQRMSLIWNLKDSKFAKEHKVCFQEIQGGLIRPTVERIYWNENGKAIIDPVSEIEIRKIADTGDSEINSMDGKFRNSAKQFRASIDSTTVPAHIFDKSKDRQWVMFVYQTTNSSGKPLTQEDYAEAAFSFFRPKFPEELDTFLTKLWNKAGIKDLDSKLSRKIFIRCMLDEIWDDTSFKVCRTKGLDILNMRVIETKADKSKKPPIPEKSKKINPTKLNQTFKAVKSSFTKIADLLVSSWQITDASCLVTNELLIMSAWYRKHPKPKSNPGDSEKEEKMAKSEYNRNIGEMSKCMMLSMVSKSTTGGPTQSTASDCCRFVRTEKNWDKIKELLEIDSIKPIDLGYIDAEQSRKIGKTPKSSLGKGSMMFHLIKLHLFRSNAKDIFDSSDISKLNWSFLNVDHFYPKAPLGMIPELRLRRNHLANFVLMKEWSNKSKKEKWPNLLIEKEKVWPSNDTEKKNFQIHAIPLKGHGSWISDPIKKYKTHSIFITEYLDFLRSRTKFIVKNVNYTLDEIESKGF